MVQWIITILIVLAACAYVGYKVFQYFRGPAVKDSECSECSSDCSECPLTSSFQNFEIKKP